MESSDLVAEQRTISVRALLRSNITNSYDGCRIYIPSANLPFTDPDLISFDTIHIFFGTSNAWRYVLRSNITDGEIFYSFLGMSGGGQIPVGNFTPVGPQKLGIVVKPTKPVYYIEMFCNGITPIAGTVNGFTEMLPSATFTQGLGPWIIVLTITFYKLKKDTK